MISHTTFTRHSRRMKTKLFWLQGIACNGNVHSFFNYPQLEQFLEDFEFIYHPVIDSEHLLCDLIHTYRETDILLIDGSISKTFERAGKSIVDIIHLYAPHVQKIVTVGTCATYGGIFRKSPYDNVSGLLFEGEEEIALFEMYKEKIVSVPGCPVHPEILINTLYTLKHQMPTVLDHYYRPKTFFAYTVHNGCTRNEYFEYKIDKHRFGEKEGCMFYDHGCQAPFTHASCNKILWNEVNSKTRIGQPCMGCTEPTFPRDDLYHTKKHMGIPQFLPTGIAKRIYLTLAGVTKAFTIDRLEKKLIDDV